MLGVNGVIDSTQVMPKAKAKLSALSLGGIVWVELQFVQESTIANDFSSFNEE
jgi:hypothetical protein